MQLTKLSISTSAVAVIALGAFAHNGASGVVLERMNGMTAMRDAMSELSPMMQGTVPYDAETVSSLSVVIGDHAGEALLGLFPEASLEGVTYARPEIWTNWQKFEALATQLQEYAVALSEAAPNGLTPNTAMEMSHGAMDMPMSPAPSSERVFSVAELLGYAAPETAAGGTEGPVKSDVMDLAMLPVPQLFEGLSSACSSCHAQFRSGRN